MINSGDRFTHEFVLALQYKTPHVSQNVLSLNVGTTDIAIERDLMDCK